MQTYRDDIVKEFNNIELFNILPFILGPEDINIYIETTTQTSLDIKYIKYRGRKPVKDTA